MREVITSILEEFDQTTRFSLGVILVQVQQLATGFRYGPEIS